MRPHRIALLALLAAPALAGCPWVPPVPPDVIEYDVQPVDASGDAPTGPTFCSLTGVTVSGAVLPVQLCIRRYAQVNEARVLTFAPNGDLFVASPSNFTPGGATGGVGKILVLSDDDHDGVAQIDAFADGIPDVHGLAISRGYLYFTTEHNVSRTPYAPGQRRETPGMREVVATFDTINSERWTHGLAASEGGAVYASQSVYSASMCPDTPRDGTIQRLVQGAMTMVAAGFRNPMYLRCHHTDEVCAAAELGDDGGGGFGAHEKILLLRPDTQYGFPCCTTTGHGTPLNGGNFDCSGVTHEESSFPLNDTPFGLDWERGMWPTPFNNALVVALHGSFYSSPQWAGARLVFAQTDPVTHAPTGPWLDLMRGFGPGGSPLERPADVAFAPDGRLFIADDTGNAVYWIAPDSLRMP